MRRADVTGHLAILCSGQEGRVAGKATTSVLCGSIDIDLWVLLLRRSVCATKQSGCVVMTYHQNLTGGWGCTCGVTCVPHSTATVTGA